MVNVAKYGIAVVQNLYQDRSGEIHNEYHIYTESGFYLGVLRLPSDGQYVFERLINMFTKVGTKK